MNEPDKIFSVTCEVLNNNTSLRRNEYVVRGNLVTGNYSGQILNYKLGWRTVDFAKANGLSAEDAAKVYEPFLTECMSRKAAVRMYKVSKGALIPPKIETAISHNGTNYKISGNVVTGLMHGKILTYKVGWRSDLFALRNGLGLDQAKLIFKPFVSACLECLEISKPSFIVRETPGKRRKRSFDKPAIVRRLPAGRCPSSGSIDGGGRQHPYTGHPDEFEMVRSFKHCRFCGKPAMAGSDLCYSCESD